MPADRQAGDPYAAMPPPAGGMARRLRRLRNPAELLSLLLLILMLGLMVGRGISAWNSRMAERHPERAQSVPPPLDQLAATPDKIDMRRDITDSLAQLTPDAARQLNASRPFVTTNFVPARPFVFRGSELDRERAVACLAAAELYEAGIDSDGQRAVAQVVLNRVRHLAYPPTICGVVFQGSARATGCQFTFTCDGSLLRRYADAAVQMAVNNARAALAGVVDGRVGLATHYHTDWVHPYWSDTLDKLVAVHTHLFFRWRGFWGSPAAFSNRYAGSEPQVTALGFFDASHRTTDEAPAAPVEEATAASSNLLAVPGLQANLVALNRPDIDPASLGIAAADMGGNRVRVAHPQGGAYLVLIPRGEKAQQFEDFARRLCGAQSFCHVMAWDSAADIPPGFPVSDAAKQRMTMQYMFNASTGVEKVKEKPL